MGGGKRDWVVLSDGKDLLGGAGGGWWAGRGGNVRVQY